MSRGATGRSRRRVAGKQRRWLVLHGPEDGEVPWARTASAMLIALGAALLTLVAFRLHPIGDYSAETDFYGSYAAGARLFQSGRLDPALYRAAGPLYDVLLGLVDWLVRDLFTAARLIAIASAVGAWILWRGLVRLRLGDRAAWWTTAFFVTNPVFFRYGYSAVSHETAICAEAASLFVLLRSSRGRGFFLAGALAGCAALVRYPGLVLLPATWLILWGFDRAAFPSRRRATLLHLAGFLLVALPWVAFSLSRGQAPAEALIGRASFYLGREGGGNVQDAPGAFRPGAGEPGAESLGRLLARDPAALVAKTVSGLFTQSAEDARDLLGVPIALLALLGLGLAAWDGSWRRLLALGAPWALHLLLLAPVFYSPVYRLPLLPVYLALAGAAIASPRLALVVSGLPVKPALALVPLALSATAVFETTRTVHDELPLEVRDAGRALAQMAAPGQRVMARKGHVGYYSGLPVVAFPRVSTIPELAAHCRENRVDWIYYSWYEALARQELLWLLDTTATVPGLRLVRATEDPPSRLFRVEAGFGALPAWWRDEQERAVHLARGGIQVLDEPQAAPLHLVLAGDAAARGDLPATLDHADAAIRGGAGSARAWLLRGAALQGMRRNDEARDAYRRALALDPGLAAASVGLQSLEGAPGSIRSP